MEEQSCCSGSKSPTSGVGFAARLLREEASSTVDDEEFQKARRLVETSNRAGLSSFRVGEVSG